MTSESATGTDELLHPQALAAAKPPEAPPAEATAPPPEELPPEELPPPPPLELPEFDVFCAEPEPEPPSIEVLPPEPLTVTSEAIRSPLAIARACFAICF